MENPQTDYKGSRLKIILGTIALVVFAFTDPVTLAEDAIFHVSYETKQAISPSKDDGKKYATAGLASWYDYDLPGAPRYSKTALTAASTHYDRGTRLTVTNLVNGKTVEVVVNDYGPEDCEKNSTACPQRIIDLSSLAFSKIANLSDGLAKVVVEPVRLYDPEIADIMNDI